jgi:Arabinose efflux permease
MSVKPRLPVTPMLGSAMFMCGVTFASSQPYHAVVGIEALGLTSGQFALVMSLGSIIGAMIAVAIGYISDRLRDRRVLVLLTAAAGAGGFALIYLVRTPWMFAVSIGMIVPLGMGMYSQTFSYVRVYYDAISPERSRFMVSAMRTVFTIAWVIIPPAVGYVAAVYSTFDVYLVAALAYALAGLVFAVLMTDPLTRIAPQSIPRKKEGAAFISLPWPVASGLAGILVINVAMRLASLAMPLMIITQLGGSLADVGIYAGIAAAVEIPFMLLWGHLLSRFSREDIIVGNALLFGAYLVLVSNAASVTDVYWLQALNGISTAALMSIPISYMQDTIKGRVGLSSSLMDVMNVSAALLGAASFGILASQQDYGWALAVAGVLGVGGGLVMLIGNFRKPRLTADP